MSVGRSTVSRNAFFAPGRHGDCDAEPGLIDFAVNVQPGPPSFVAEALRSRIDGLAAYPTDDDERRALTAVAAAHGRTVDEVLLLEGAAEGFEVLARLRPRHVALIEPSFTEPERVLRAAGARCTSVTLAPPWRVSQARVPDDADLVIVGNPTNPTSVLHPRAEILALRRPGRLVVVDEAFADLTLDPDSGVREPESLAGMLPDGVIVIRSITKTFGLAGLRAGYLLAAPETIARLSAGRRHWPLGTLALTALAACVGPVGERYAADLAVRIAEDRTHLVESLRAAGPAEAGLEVTAEPRAPYVLIRVPDGLALKEALRTRGFGVRSCANFTGLGPEYLRLAVRSPDRSAALVRAVQDVLETEGDRS
ncbi:MAG: Rv2231c family pyridoxal phosphate-dependent protein CobC [Gordonia sp. (in: high G+C Gram-positive bacteria)]|uniref:Rv2231c family pyridoxal phosphate-dependent protein CobC n=1 Tax=Gordonia sp. (in: high G+C Gram-positive bacteria) TaxID=84139 RepID=UPI0039E5A21E